MKPILGLEDSPPPCANKGEASKATRIKQTNRLFFILVPPYTD
jgi:hypothetical protein